MSVSFVRSSERNNCDNCLFSLFKHNTVQIVFNNSGHVSGVVATSKEPVCPRVELILKIIIILLIIFLGFIKSKPC